LYSEGDGAEDILFVVDGKIKLYVDISEQINLPSGTIDFRKQGFNVPICMFETGSYFGD
jgi:hypothetical protein